MIDNIIHISRAVIAMGFAALIVGFAIFISIIAFSFLREFFRL